MKSRQGGARTYLKSLRCSVKQASDRLSKGPILLLNVEPSAGFLLVSRQARKDEHTKPTAAEFESQNRHFWLSYYFLQIAYASLNLLLNNTFYRYWEWENLIRSCSSFSFPFFSCDYMISLVPYD